MRDLYIKNYKTLLKKINRWKDFMRSWIGSLTIVKMTTVPNAIYKFNAILIKIPVNFLQKQKIHHKISMEFLFQTILKNKNKVEWTHMSGFQNLLQSCNIWKCGTGKYIDLCNRIDSPEINSYMYSQLILNKSPKTIQWGKHQ